MKSIKVDREYIEIYPVNWEIVSQNTVNKIFSTRSSDEIRDISLYVHIPFCPTICPFCKFNIDNDTLKFTAERQDGTIIENIEYHINSSTNFKKQDDLLEANFKVFSDEKNIHIVIKSLSNSILEIFDENGLSLIKMNSNKPEELIPNYNKGFYFVRISVADKSIVKKILLE